MHSDSRQSFYLENLIVAQPSLPTLVVSYQSHMISWH